MSQDSDLSGSITGIASGDTQDRTLSHGGKSDDAATLELLIARHGDLVARLATRLLGGAGDTDDVVQDVFLAAYRGLHRFRAEADPRTWLLKITLNQCRITHRRRKVRRIVFGGAAAEQALSLAPARGPRSHDEDALESVRQAVYRLPYADREIIVLHYLEQASIESIARCLGLRTNTLEQRLSRARNRMRADLERVAQKQ